MSITKKMQLFARNNFLKLEIPDTKTNVSKDDVERISQDAIVSSNQNASILANQNEADINDMIFDINIWMKLGKYISDRDNQNIN